MHHLNWTGAELNALFNHDKRLDHKYMVRTILFCIFILLLFFSWSFLQCQNKQLKVNFQASLKLTHATQGVFPSNFFLLHSSTLAILLDSTGIFFLLISCLIKFVFAQQILIPVCEPLNPKLEVVVHLYWVLNINFRDRGFQILDSWRSINDKALKTTYSKIVATMLSLWDTHYKDSKVHLDEFKVQEIQVPKQATK
jgi:hypothetical protein